MEHDDSMTIWIADPRTEQDGDFWNAYSEEFNLASCGSTKDEAINNVINAVKAYSRALRNRNMLERVLEEKNIKYSKGGIAVSLS